MEQRVFVYGTLMRGEANHGMLADARFAGVHRTEPRFTMLLLGAYPGLIDGGSTAVTGEVYGVNRAVLVALDRLEDYPRLYDRCRIHTPYGSAWFYLYRGGSKDRPVIVSGNWRQLTRAGTPMRAAAVRNRRDPKNPTYRCAMARQSMDRTQMTPGTSPSPTGDPDMSEQGRFTIHLEQQEGYQINVRFDWKRAADLLMDEPPPLGETSGPNASRLLAAAAANCLSASLLHCLAKEEPPEKSLRAEATCILVRNDRKRLRIGGLEIKLIAGDALSGSRRFDRCRELFEDFCVVSASIRDGIPIAVTVVDQAGNLLHSSD